MKARPIVFAAAMSILFAFIPAPTHAADAPQAKGATSVAEMMRQKRDQQLRLQLVSEGRWSEVQQLDEEISRGVQQEHERRLHNINQQLARSVRGSVMAGDASMGLCDVEIR